MSQNDIKDRRIFKNLKNRFPYAKLGNINMLLANLLFVVIVIVLFGNNYFKSEGTAKKFDIKFNENSIFKPNNMIIVVSNIIFFIIVQTIFFNTIASKQFNNVLKKKVDIINEYLNLNPEFKKIFSNYKKSDEYKETVEIASKQYKETNKYNTDLTLKRILPVLIFFVLVLIIFIFLLKKSNMQWTDNDWAGISLIVFAYFSEILFYLIVITQYNFYTDSKMYYKIFNSLIKNSE